MHARIVTWRLGQDEQSPDGYTRLLADIADRNTSVLREIGLLDAFVTRVALDTIMTVHVYEDEADAHDAWSRVISTMDQDLVGRISMIEVQEGETIDLASIRSET